MTVFQRDNLDGGGFYERADKRALDDERRLNCNLRRVKPMPTASLNCKSQRQDSTASVTSHLSTEVALASAAQPLLAIVLYPIILPIIAHDIS